MASVEIYTVVSGCKQCKRVYRDGRDTCSYCSNKRTLQIGDWIRYNVKPVEARFAVVMMKHNARMVK